VRPLIANELILSLVPDEEQRTWRNLTRMKTQLTRDRVRLQHQMECLLERIPFLPALFCRDGAGGVARATTARLGGCGGQWLHLCALNQKPSHERQFPNPLQDARGRSNDVRLSAR
jgi:hypothetical protein